jgi:hypothetical protein
VYCDKAQVRVTDGILWRGRLAVRLTAKVAVVGTGA